ncbi:MAG: DNA repair protein RadA [Chloroflexi bacterium]|nr:DNA repair protein RadA [Chloroflexota bacterium]
MARPQSRFVCQSCGDWTVRWEGQCRGCGAWNTLVETLVREEARSPGRPSADDRAVASAPVPLRELTEAALTRVASGMGEVDRVLGGGLVPGSVVLLGGEPGIGKSTLVMQIASGGSAVAAGTERVVLYASGEESGGQLRLRAERLGLLETAAGAAVRVVAETEVERIVGQARDLPLGLLIVDSVQTLRVEGLDGPAGSVGQVREATQRLADYARAESVPVVVVGHVTKEGNLAGPKTLEHLVDVVLTLEGERSLGLRLLRSTKNRFGSTEEVGVLEMGGDGLREVSDPARAFLGAGAMDAPGSVVGVSLEGSRPLLVEVQALVAPTTYGNPRRTVGGLDGSRLALLVAVLGRRAGINLGSHDIYASLTGGLTAEEPALDLPLALALASSLRDRPVPAGVVVCGEVGLLGELRPVSGVSRRLREAGRLGFRRAIVPAERVTGTASSVGEPELEIMRASTLREALEMGLGTAVASVR